MLWRQDEATPVHNQPTLTHLHTHTQDYIYTKYTIIPMNCPIPFDLDLHQHWRNHSIVTDEMVAYLKKSFRLKPHEGLMEVSRKRFESLFFPLEDGQCAWQRMDIRNGAFQPIAPEVVAPTMIITDKNGRNPMVVPQALEVFQHKDIEGKVVATGKATIEDNDFIVHVKRLTEAVDMGNSIMRLNDIAVNKISLCQLHNEWCYVGRVIALKKQEAVPH